MLRFAGGAAAVTCGPGGRLEDLRHAERPDLCYLAGLRLGSVQLAGVEVAAEEVELSLDADELEVSQRHGPVRVVLRHTFAAGWGIRLTVANSTDAAVRLDEVRLEVTPGAQTVGWALTAGADASLSVHPADGRGPVLGGVLRLGALERAAATELATGPVGLAPRGRYALAWQWDFYPTPAAFGRGRHPYVPSALCHLLEAPAAVEADPDSALTATGPVQVVEVSARRRELVGARPGHGRVVVGSAAGRTAYDLEWVPAPDELAARQIGRAHV